MKWFPRILLTRMEGACVTDLKPITALGASSARVQSMGSLTLCETPHLAFASLALRRGQGVPTPFGLTLPQAGGFVGQNGLGAFWTGSDQWMLCAEGRGDSDFAADVRAQAPGCSVTEQTDGWAAVDVTVADDAQMQTLLAKLFNLNPEFLSPGHATRTGLHHMTVFVVRPNTTQLRVIGMRSLADSLWHTLETTAKRLGVSSRPQAQGLN